MRYRKQHWCLQCEETFETHYEWRHHYCLGGLEREIRRYLNPQFRIFNQAAEAMASLGAVFLKELIPVVEQFAAAAGEFGKALALSVDDFGTSSKEGKSGTRQSQSQ